MNKYTIVSLFSGCGGMDLGFLGGFTYLDKFYKPHPFEVIFSNDIDKYACKTYNYNFKDECVCEDINKIDFDQIPNGDVVLGGFPCQDFSLAGKRKGFKSKRGQLYKTMLSIVKKIKPKIFVAENVEGIKSNIDNDSPLDQIIKDFTSIGYNTEFRLLNAADYGVPQTRKRIIIIGVRNDLNISPIFPEPVLSNGDWISAKEAIDDLWDMLDKANISNHTIKDFSKAKFSSSNKGQGNRQIDADKPSITIRAEHHGNIEAHYRSLDPIDPLNKEKWRRLSVRECARLQSFPDDFVFPCAASSAYKQVGNAVPPVLARHISKTVLDLLNIVS